MWSSQYWKATGERAVKTFAQSLVPLITASLLTQPDWADISAAVGLSACAAGISVLTSMASTLRGDPDSPSLIEPSGRHSTTDLG